MTQQKKNNDVFDNVANGLEDALRWARGEISLRVWEFDDPPPELSATEILDVRQQRNLSQAEFARLLNVSLKTMQSWEQGSRKPSQAALRLLQIMSAKPKSAKRAATSKRQKKKPA